MRFQVTLCDLKLEVANCDLKMEHSRVVIRMRDMETPASIRDARIYVVRGHRIMLDTDLAEIYDVSTGRLNEQVRRNIDRFPDDFLFKLTPQEVANLKSQFAISSSSWGGRRSRPLAFTEHGAVMLAAVLNSPTAVQASVAIARAFVRLRREAFGRRELASRLKELEKRVGANEGEIRELFDALNALIDGPLLPGKKIGFQP